MNEFVLHLSSTQQLSDEIAGSAQLYSSEHVPTQTRYTIEAAHRLNGENTIYRGVQLRHQQHLNRLNGEIRHLRYQITALSRGVGAIIPAKNNFWNIAVDYFRVFRHGLLNGPQLAAQETFLRENMHNNLVYNSGYGRLEALRSLCCSQWFGGFEVELRGLLNRGTNSLVATTKTSVTITERTLCGVFPHLFSEDNGGIQRTLGEKLVGQRIIMNGSTHFEWDQANCRLVSVVVQSDMLTPILHLVGSLENVAYVFDEALITLDFQRRYNL
ncbi:hypothetical protein F441_14960 [Phytophthora nicotianae CJ01A1]|uniref:Uncharacterized protein n=1 Tax=Phytophthora nicotianae CJ01A1 TaxID=1317063 RepID=W2WF86_PHYNI|nr:hypothetical protein F441_14960 [Phytophthora nicotianae CJ01A1]